MRILATCNMPEAPVSEDDTPSARGMPWGISGIAIEQFRKLCHPSDALISHIPNQRQRAAAMQDTNDFRGCLVIVEPMESRRAPDKANRSIGHRNGLGPANPHLYAWQAIEPDASRHLFQRFHGDDPLARQGQKLS